MDSNARKMTSEGKYRLELIYNKIMSVISQIVRKSVTLSFLSVNLAASSSDGSIWPWNSEIRACIQFIEHSYWFQLILSENIRDNTTISLFSKCDFNFEPETRNLHLEEARLSHGIGENIEKKLEWRSIEQLISKSRLTYERSEQSSRSVMIHSGISLFQWFRGIPGLNPTENSKKESKQWQATVNDHEPRVLKTCSTS